MVNFTLLGIASGFLLAAGWSAWLGNELVGFYGISGVIATLLALVTRLLAMARNRGLKHKSTLPSAIGVRHSELTQKAQGAMGGSFNTREFFHGRSAGTLTLVRALFLVLTFPIPVLLIALAHWLESPVLPLAAFGVQYLGLLAERWYFFAEAKHPQNLYYQSIA